MWDIKNKIPRVYRNVQYNYDVWYKYSWYDGKCWRPWAQEIQGALGNTNFFVIMDAA